MFPSSLSSSSSSSSFPSLLPPFIISVRQSDRFLLRLNLSFCYLSRYIKSARKKRIDWNKKTKTNKQINKLKNLCFNTVLFLFSEPGSNGSERDDSILPHSLRNPEHFRFICLFILLIYFLILSSFESYIYYTYLKFSVESLFSIKHPLFRLLRLAYILTWNGACAKQYLMERFL